MDTIRPLYSLMEQDLQTFERSGEIPLRRRLESVFNDERGDDFRFTLDYLKSDRDPIRHSKHL